MIIIITPLLFIFYIMVWIQAIKIALLILINIKKNYIIEYPLPKDKVMFIGPYIEFIPSFSRVIRNIIYKSKKNGFLRIYAIFNKDKRIDARLLEPIFFRYLFRIPLYLARSIVLLIKNIGKLDKNKIFRIRIKSKIKEFIIGIMILSDEEPSMAWNFKIIINNKSIKTNGYNEVISKIMLENNSGVNTISSLGYVYNGKNGIKFMEHLKMRVESKNYSLASSEEVYYYDKNKKEKWY